MKLNLLLTVYAIANAFFGIMMFVTPATVVAWYGLASLDPVAAIAFRYAGTLGIGAAILAWAARTALPGKLRSVILLSFAVTNFLGMIVSYLASTSGAFSNLAWSEVLFYGLWTVLFAIAGRSTMVAAKAQTN